VRLPPGRTSELGWLLLDGGEQAIGIVRHDTVDPGAGQQAHVSGIVDGPADHLKVAFVGFVQEIRSNEISADGNLARSDVRGFRQDVLDLIVEKKAGHQRGLQPAKPFENAGVERDDHDASDLLGFAESADERMLSSPEAIGLQFEIENDVVFAGKFQDFRECGDALTHEFTAKPGTGIEAANFGKRHGLDGALTGGGAIDGLVVEGDKVRVASEVKIGLNKSDAQRGGAAEGSQGVLRGITGSSTMSNSKHGRENLH
jgi:hypothetical protein